MKILKPRLCEQAHLLFILPFFILILFLLTSCTEKNTAVLWSNKKEVASIVELYNRNNDDYKIIFQYKENPAAAYIQTEIKPDILIGEDLQNKKIKSELMNLDNFFKENFPSGNEINLSLTDSVYFDGSRRLLPISFALTVAVFNKNTKRINQELPSLELEQMMIDSTSFNQDQQKIGYSPLWDENFIYALLSLYGSSFTSSDTNDLIWDEEHLNDGIDFIKKWNELNGGSEKMEYFNNKYLYDNRIKILKEERILMTTMSSSEFMELSDVMTRGLNFLYISKNFSLNPENIVYGGISRDTSAPDPSSDFLTWLVKSDTQEQILSESLKNKEGSFGILGGFSSINDVNGRIYLLYYPQLKGKIPDINYILHEQERPVDFNSIKKDLITSWVRNTTSTGNTTLNDAHEKWEKLRIPF